MILLTGGKDGSEEEGTEAGLQGREVVARREGLNDLPPYFCQERGLIVQIEIRCGKCGGKLTLVEGRAQVDKPNVRVVVQADPCQTCIVDAKRQFNMLANFVDMARAMERNREPEGGEGGPVQFPDMAKMQEPVKFRRFGPLK